MSYLHRPPPLGAWRHVPRAATAYHEAAHVVAAASTFRRIGSATVVPDGATDGAVRVTGARIHGDEVPTSPAPPSDGQRALGLIYQAAFLLAGPIGERLGVGEAAGGEHDERDAVALLGEAAALIGVPAQWWREHLAGTIEHGLRQNWPSVEAVTRLLLDVGTVDGAQLHALLDGVSWLNVQPVALHIAALAGVNVAEARVSG